MGYQNDREFQERMLSAVCRDRKFLSRVSGLLNSDDFKTKKDEGSVGRARWRVAQVALQFWKDYQEPIGGMLRTEMQDHVRQNKKEIGNQDRIEIFTLVERIGNEPQLWSAVEAVEEKVISFKQRERFRWAIDEMIRMQEDGQLGIDEFQSITRNALNGVDYKVDISDYGTGLEERIKQRQLEQELTLPYFYIDKLDEQVRMAPRGQIQVALAKYGVGKSHFMVHLAKVSAMQGYNAMLYTLEDPKSAVEARLDASLAGIAIESLSDNSELLRQRFQKMWKRMRAKIKVVDATDGNWSVERMERLWETERNRGFTADLVLVDYDKKILPPPNKYAGDQAERLRSTDVYQGLSRWAQRAKIFMWVAAQARRGKKDDKQVVVTGDDAAEDINKLREAGFCLGIGYGPQELMRIDENGEVNKEDRANMRFLFVAKNRFGRAQMGWPIMGNYPESLFYDREESMRLQSSWKDRLGLETRKRKFRNE